MTRGCPEAGRRRAAWGPRPLLGLETYHGPATGYSLPFGPIHFEPLAVNGVLPFGLSETFLIGLQFPGQIGVMWALD